MTWEDRCHNPECAPFFLLPLLLLAQQQQKHPCVINSVFSRNPEHNPVLPTVKKSIPAKTRTAHYCKPQESSPGIFQNACWGLLYNLKFQRKIDTDKIDAS